MLVPAKAGWARKMISLDKAVIARFSKNALNFEVLVEPELAYRARKGERVNLENLVASQEVYSDAKKGLRVADSDLNKAFGTNNFEKILYEILTKGDIQLTTDQKRKIQEQREKQVVTLIARSAVDPRTHLPHPPIRIEKAIEEAKVHIDAFKSAEEQLENVLKALKPILPIKLETVKIVLKIPASNAMRAYGFLKQHKLLKEEWANNGDLLAMIELPAGLQSEFFDKLNSLTQGNNESKVIERT